MPTDQDDKSLVCWELDLKSKVQRNLAEAQQKMVETYLGISSDKRKEDPKIGDDPTQPSDPKEWFVGVDPDQWEKDRTARMKEIVTKTPPSPQENSEGLLAKVERLIQQTSEAKLIAGEQSHRADVLSVELDEAKRSLAKERERAASFERLYDSTRAGLKTWRQMAEDLQKVFDANEARNRLRKPGIEVHEVGAKVIIEDSPDVRGCVDAVIIEGTGVTYRVSWWSGRSHHEAIFMANLIRADDDHLPIPGTEGPSHSVGRDPS